jgi:hypothetical protein
MLSENIGPFPHLTVRSVTLNNDDMQVNASLTVRGDSPRPFWLNEREFSQFVKIYIVAVHSKELRGRADVPSTAQLADYTSRASHRALTSGPDLEWDQKFYANCDHSILTLTEVMDLASESLITTSEIDRNVDKLSDINFSVSIRRTKYNYRNEQLLGLELFAFTHLDVKGLVEHYRMTSRSQTIADLLRIGGNFSRETLLVREEAGPLYVPETTTVLTYQDGTPFTGLYHYHASNSGPDGYTGYMEGPRDSMRSDTRRLTTSRVRYTKVTANFLLDDSLFRSGYNGSRQEIESLDYSFLTPYLDTRTIFDNELSDGVYDNQRQEVLKKEYFEEQARNTDFEVVQLNANWIQTDRDASGNFRGSHDAIFEINWEKIIRTKSKYGFFLDLLRDNPIDSSVGLGFEIKTDLQSLINMVEIKQMSIHRTRMSNNPRSNNPVGTADYDVFDKEQIPTTLISTSDEFVRSNNKYILKKKETPKAKIMEYPQNSNKKRKFLIQDKDMFDNISFGNYEYSFEMVIEDKIKKVFVVALQNLEGLLSKYKEFLTTASVPYIERPYSGNDAVSNSFIRQDPQLPRVGNYIIKSEEYTPAFRAESARNYDQNTKRMIQLYIIMSSWLGQFGPGASGQERSRLIRQLEASIVPMQGGSIVSAHRFEEACTTLAIEYRRIMSRENVKEIDSFTMDSPVDSYVKLGARYPSAAKINEIKISKVIPGFAKAFRSGEIFLSYDVGDMSDFMQRRQERLDSEIDTSDTNISRLNLQPTRYLTNTTPGSGLQEILNYRSETSAGITNLGLGNSGLGPEIVENTLTTPPEQTVIDLGRPLPTFASSFGIPGISIGIPGSNTTIVNNADISQALSNQKPSDQTVGLPEVLERAMTDSLDNDSIAQQFTNNGDLMAKEESSVSSRDVLNGIYSALATTTTVEPTGINRASTSPADKTGQTTPMNRLFGSNASEVMMVSDSNGPMSEMVPLTEASVRSSDSETIVIAVSSKEGENSNQNYRATNNVAVVSVSEALEMLNTPSGTSTGNALARSASNTGVTRTTAAAINRLPTGRY